MHYKKNICFIMAMVMVLSQITPVFAAQESNEIYTDDYISKPADSPLDEDEGRIPEENEENRGNKNPDDIESLAAGISETEIDDACLDIEDESCSKTAEILGSEDLSEKPDTVIDLYEPRNNDKDIPISHDIQAITTVSLDDIILTYNKSKSIKIKEIKGKDKKSLVWTSSDPKVASVSSKGKVKALDRGIAYISASYPSTNTEYIAKVIVNKPELTHKKVTLSIGEDYWISLTGILSEDIRWTSKSGNATQLLNDNGSAHFIAKTKGSQKYTATINGKKYKFTVKVNDELSPPQETKYTETILYEATKDVKGEKLYTAPNGSSYIEYYTLNEETSDKPDETYTATFYLDHPQKSSTKTESSSDVIKMPGIDDFEDVSDLKGYSFAGWKTDNSSDETIYQPGQSIKITKNISFHGIWNLETYKITYVLSGGENPADNPAEYDITTPDITLKDAKRQDYAFKGWFTDPEYKHSISTINTSDCKDITVYAKWRSNEFDISEEAGYEGVYDKNSHSISLNVATPGATITYSTDDLTYSSEKPSFTNAGEYTVYYKINKEGYKEYKNSQTVNISKAPIKIIKIPKVKDDLVYNGKEQVLCEAGEIEGGIFLYATGSYVPNDFGYRDFRRDTPWSESLPKYTGMIDWPIEYTVYTSIKITDDNYFTDDPLPGDYDIGTVSITPITKKTISDDQIIIHTAIGTYSGSMYNPLPITFDPSIMKATVSYGLTEGEYPYTSVNDKDLGLINAGTKTIYYKVSHKYYFDKFGSYTLTVYKAPGQINTHPKKAKESLVYTGEEQALITPGESSTGTMLYSLDGGAFSEDIPKATDAGEYNIAYISKGDDNHEDSEAYTFDVSIEKANVQSIKSPLPVPGLKYNGSEQALVTTGTVSGGTIYYGLGQSEEDGPSYYDYSNKIPTAKDSGTYYVWMEIRGDENHASVEPYYCSKVNIGKTSLTSTAPVAKTDLVYDGKAQTLCSPATVSGGTTYYKCSYNTEDFPFFDEWDIELPTGTDAGYYQIYVKLVPDDNHFLDPDICPYYQVEAKINPSAEVLADLTNIFAENATYEYDGTAHYLSPVWSPTERALTIKYGLSQDDYPYDSITDTALGQTETGSKTVYYKVSKYGYNDVEGSYTLTVTNP